MHADFLTIDQIAARDNIDATALHTLVDTHRFIVPGVRTITHDGAQVVRSNDYEPGMVGDNYPWSRSEPTDMLAIGFRDGVRCLTAWTSTGGLDYDDPREIVSIRASEAVIEALRTSPENLIRVPGHRNAHVLGGRHLDPADHFDEVMAPLGSIGIDIRFTYLDCEIETGWRDNYPGGSTTELPYREIGGW